MEFSVLPHGPYKPKSEAKPQYLQHPDEKAVEYQKRKAQEEESEAKRRRSAEEEVERERGREGREERGERQNKANRHMLRVCVSISHYAEKK